MIPFPSPLLGCIPYNDVAPFCRFYMILKLSNSRQLFLLCPRINALLSKAFAFLADIITGSADPYMGHTLEPDIFKRGDLHGPYMWFITGLQVPLVNCLFRIWCWKIYWWNSITASWSFGLGNAEFICVDFMTFTAFSISSNFNACTGFFSLFSCSLGIAPFCFMWVIMFDSTLRDTSYIFRNASLHILTPLKL